jgi:two-component system sensor histidine kinase/response regulator
LKANCRPVFDRAFLGVSACLAKPVRRRELKAILSGMGEGRFADGKAASGPPPEPAAPAARPSPQRILLTEDNPINQRLAVRLLAKEGHSVVVASNGEEALAQWQRQPFDLILMDVQMPVMDGLETARAIRRAEGPSHRRIPIIGFTAHARNEDRDRCLQSGMDDFLIKPIRARDLFQMVLRYSSTAEKS